MVYVFIFSVGILSVVFTIIIKILKIINLLKNGIRSNGKVVDIIETRNSDNDIVYRPLLKINYNDKELLVKPKIGVYRKNIQVGENLEVIFLQDKVEFCRINRFIYLWGDILVLIFFAISLVIAFVYLVNNNFIIPRNEDIKLPYT